MEGSWGKMGIVRTINRRLCCVQVGTLGIISRTINSSVHWQVFWEVCEH